MSEVDPDNDLPVGSDLRRIRQMHRDRRAAEDRALEAKARVGFGAADIENYEQYQRLQTVRDLRRQERLIAGIERIRDSQISLYWERGLDKHY